MNIEFDRVHYDPQTGLFTWKRPVTKHVQAGDLAGWVNANGYVWIRIKSKKCVAHRLAWRIVYGTWPDSDIDHINGVKTDNRITNLRLASKQQNSFNRIIHSKNSSGFRGVTWHSSSSKWWVRVTLDGKTRSFGLHKNLADAAKVANDARKKLFGVYARA